MVKRNNLIERRDLLKTGAVISGSAIFGFLSGLYKFQIGQNIVADEYQISPSRDHLLMPTPSCTHSDTTPLVSEGPFYSPASPHQIDLRTPKTKGENLRLAGRVMDRQCRPIAGAVLDFWQTNPKGTYDHFGYAYRGHQFTDMEGRYELLTYLPASYKFMGVWRRRHIHVKIAAPSHRLLTSQVFFPFGPDKMVRDFSFDQRLVSTIERPKGNFIEARFDFVLENI